MSGRPRTTSFAESCKPVQQPSAFGSMKVSSEYWFYFTPLRHLTLRITNLEIPGSSNLRPPDTTIRGNGKRQKPVFSQGWGSSLFSPPILPPPVSLTLNWENMLFIWMIWFAPDFFFYTFLAVDSQLHQVLKYFHVKIVMEVFTCSSFWIKRRTRLDS